MSQSVHKKYEEELTNIDTVFDKDEYIHDLWVNYGFKINGEIVDLNSNINVYEACFIGLCVKTYLNRYVEDKTSSLNILEIGLAYGTSSIHIVNQLLPHKGDVNYTVIDPNQSTTWKSIGINNIRDYLKQKNNSSIHLHLMEKFSQDAMVELDGEYDIIFIDGSHGEEIVIQDLMNSHKLLKPNGIMIVDDVKHSGVKKALNRFTRENNSAYSRITIMKEDSPEQYKFNQLPAIDKNSNEKKNIYDTSTMFCYQKKESVAAIVPEKPLVENNATITTIRSLPDALRIAESYIHREDTEKIVDDRSIIPDYYVPPPETRDNIWAMNMDALKNTLEYIIDYLNHSCYMLCVKSNVGSLYKLERHQTANVYKPFIQKSIWQLNRNPKLNPQNKEFIRRSLQHKELRFMQCVVKQYFAGKESFADEYVDFINGVLLPDGVYIMNLTDSVILRKDGCHPFPMVVGKLDIGKYKKSKFIPIFSLSGQKGYHDIPIPNYDDVMYALGKTNIDYNSFEIDWEKKATKAVFRGGPTGCGYTTETNSRLKLASIKSNYLDVGISGKSKFINTNSIRYDPKYGIGMLNTNILSTQKFMTMAEQSRNKYIIHIDGNVHAYRMLTTMATGSLILRVESDYTSWLDHILKPNVHYIPVKSNLSDLIEKIEYCIKNDDKCKEIAKNACTIARDIVKLDKLRAIFRLISSTVCHHSQRIKSHIKPPMKLVSEERLRPQAQAQDRPKMQAKSRRSSYNSLDMLLDINVKKTKRCPNGRHRVQNTKKCRLTGEHGTLSSPHLSKKSRSVKMR